jgi:hypothetical protein
LLNLSGRSRRCQIVRRGNGKFVEVAIYGVGGRRGFLLIPEGRGGWVWLKFVGELRKAKDFLVAMTGYGFGSFSPAEKEGGKVGPRMGKVLNCNKPSFVEVVRAELRPTATAMFTSSTQGNPLGKEHADNARPLGFSSNGPQGKDRLCSVPGDVACSCITVVVFTCRCEGDIGSSWGVDELGPGFWTGPKRAFGSY